MATDYLCSAAIACSLLKLWTCGFGVHSDPNDLRFVAKGAFVTAKLVGRFLARGQDQLSLNAYLPLPYSSHAHAHKTIQERLNNNHSQINRNHPSSVYHDKQLAQPFVLFVARIQCFVIGMQCRTCCTASRLCRHCRKHSQEQRTIASAQKSN
jgi:hypothetical protein